MPGGDRRPYQTLPRRSFFLLGLHALQLGIEVGVDALDVEVQQLLPGCPLPLSESGSVTSGLLAKRHP